MTNRLRVTSRNFAKREKRFSPKLPRTLQLVGLQNFIWLAALLIATSVLHVKGTPHVLFDYRYAGSKYNKTDCTYIGLHTQRVAASSGHCPALVLLKGKA